VHIVGFYRMYRDARFSECQICHEFLTS